MDLKEIGWDGKDWLYLAQDRETVEVSCEYGNEPMSSIKRW
jgi:hypothetical protein